MVRLPHQGDYAVGLHSVSVDMHTHHFLLRNIQSTPGMPSQMDASRNGTGQSTFVV
jgi:hypothetical protein